VEQAGEVRFVLALALLLTPTPTLADHPGPFRAEGMSPLTSALLTGGLALLVALVVVVIVLVLTRKGHDSE
jgi:hypothetical protein